MEENFADVPVEHRFITGGDWYDCDNLAHTSGVEMSSGCWLAVTDDMTGETLLETELDPEVLAGLGIGVTEFENIKIDTGPGRAIFVGQNFEKGLFFQTEVEITEPFDPKQLSFAYSTYDGWRVCHGVEYNGEELDGQDAYSTMGKSSSYQLFLSDEEDEALAVLDRADVKIVDHDVEVLEGEETWSQRVIDESDVGPWHDTLDHDPVYVGYYDCRVLSIVWPEQRLRWSGTDWFTDNGDPMRLHVSHWRGLNHPPVDQ
jgi:hypothetical protein